MSSFWSSFLVARHNQPPKALQYLLGLMKLEKGKAHLKKGDKSVAVGKQYAGLVGKVENCQV
ncbi:MAG TPA: hypothetical protein DCR93_29095 [Cytophagales bacterium]|nr:hypothetical protein [Cytophagales bacterium]